MRYGMAVVILLVVFTARLDAATRSVAPGESIQAAMDEVHADGGGIVTLQAGTHSITTSVKIKSNVTLQGEGEWDSKIKTTESIKLIEQNNYGMVNVTVRNLELQGTNASDGGGISIISYDTDHDNVNVLNVHCYETGWGVHIKGATNVTVQDCLFERNGTAGKEGYAHNMYLRRCYGAVVRDSRFLDSISANGINISYSEDIEIYNCEMSGNYFRGVRAADSDGFKVHDCVITDNGNVGLLANTENVVTKNIDWDNNCVSNNGSLGIYARSGATGSCTNNNAYGNSDDYSLPSTVTQSGNISDAGIVWGYSGDRSNKANAFSVIEAEAFFGLSGIDTEDCSEGGQNVGWIHDGDWCAYYGIDFSGGASGFQARVSSSNAGGNIEIRLDSLTGTLIGTCPVAHTGGWQDWETRTADIAGVSGVHDVYLVFTGADAGYLFNVNWFTFTPYAGDLTLDGKVDLEDIAALSMDWQSVYMMDDLLTIANHWLNGK